jgi:hypothetical protein
MRVVVSFTHIPCFPNIRSWIFSVWFYLVQYFNCVFLIFFLRSNDQGVATLTCNSVYSIELYKLGVSLIFLSLRIINIWGVRTGQKIREKRIISGSVVALNFFFSAKTSNSPIRRIWLLAVAGAAHWKFFAKEKFANYGWNRHIRNFCLSENNIRNFSN